MAGYQITIRTPNGKGWRIRTTTAADFGQIARELIDSASEKIRLVELNTLWPDATAAHWHRFGASIFETVLKSVGNQIRAGRLDVLKSGEGLLSSVGDLLQAGEWKGATCSDVGKRIIKVLLSLALAYLRTQFPVITPATTATALTIIDRLVGQRSAA